MCLESVNLFRVPINKLRTGKNEETSLSKEQCCCLLSLVLFGFFKDTEKCSFEYILMNDIEKFKCLLSYFDAMMEMSTEEKKRKIVFQRYLSLDDNFDFEQEPIPLTHVEVKNGYRFEEKKIESNSLQSCHMHGRKYQKGRCFEQNLRFR